MLGRLATWLRLLGHDVTYDRDMDDYQLIRHAGEEGRIIITRDTGIIRRKSARNCIFIASDHVAEQLAELKQVLGPVERFSRTRCPRCNGELEYMDKTESVRELVPDYIYHAYERFQQCGSCGKIYWEGSHYRHMKKTLQQVLQ